MTEKVERLPIKEHTKRMLYMFSGNKCANPACKDPELVGKDGYLGNISHIEAAEKGGPRFNENMTNEQRRAYENLILVCNKCNSRFDNIEENYTVADLKKMKKQHEDYYRKIYDAYLDKVSVLDHTESGFITPCVNAQKFCPELTQDEAAVTCDDINEYFNRWNKVPRDSREYAAVILNRGNPHTGYYGDTTIQISYVLMKKICGLTDRQMDEHIEVLTECKVGYRDIEESFDEPSKAVICISYKEWPLLKELQEFNLREGTRMEDFFVDGNLTLLDM